MTIKNTKGRPRSMPENRAELIKYLYHNVSAAFANHVGKMLVESASEAEREAYQRGYDMGTAKGWADHAYHIRVNPGVLESESAIVAALCKHDLSGLDTQTIKSRCNIRVGTKALCKCLRMAGYERRRARILGRLGYVWRKRDDKAT